MMILLSFLTMNFVIISMIGLNNIYLSFIDLFLYFAHFLTPLLCRYWLCAATGPTIKIWDLESKNMVEELRPEVPGSARSDPPQCLSLAWSADGQTLFAGYSDNLIRVWQV